MHCPFEPSRLQAVESYLRQHPKVGERLAGRALGLPRSSVGRMLRYLRRGGTMPAVTPGGLSNTPSPGHRENSDGSIELVTTNPCTLDDLLKACKTDLTVWRVKNHQLNKWEVGAKQEDGRVTRTPLYQIKAWLERIPGADEAKVLKETLEWIRHNPCVPRKVVCKPAPVAVEDPVMLEISPCDLHLDKLAWAPESGDNWDMKISSSVYLKAIRQLVHLSSAFPVSRILFVVGHDFFTSDDADGNTANGTPQDVDGRWAKSFRVGVALQREAIEFLRTRAPQVDVMVVVGNHDKTRMFYAGEVLAAIYEGVPGVRIFNSPAPRKYYRFGTTLLGFTHKPSNKAEKLPLLMAGEAPADWAATTHREIHCGHLHHKNETRFIAGTEVGPVRVRILPSLTGADAWHAEEGYVGAKRAAEAYLWSKLRGYVGHLSWGPPEQRTIEVVRAA